MSWPEQAEALLGGITETGMTAAAIVAAAWRAGVDAAATDGLVGASLAMFAEPKDLLAGGMTPLPSDAEMLSQAADVATDTGNHAAAVRALATQTERALNMAIAAAAAASAEARAAKTSADAAAAQRAGKRALAEITDCEYALEILANMDARLARALDCLSSVPDDLLATYERVYEHLRARRTLPFDGTFLTGVPA